MFGSTHTRLVLEPDIRRCHANSEINTKMNAESLCIISTDENKGHVFYIDSFKCKMKSFQYTSGLSRGSFTGVVHC